MTKNNNLIPVNKAPIEIVYELKDEYKIPSYEEFMKGYKAGENLNYTDLGHNDIGTPKAYGPCITPSTSSRRFRFGYKAVNYMFGDDIAYSRIYESPEELRNDINNIHTKQGYWATERFLGIFTDRRITDFQASEGYRYAKWALDQYDKGYFVNLKAWCVSHSGGSWESRSQYMGDSLNWQF